VLNFIYGKFEQMATWRIFAVLFLFAVLCTFNFQIRNRELGPDVTTFDGRGNGYTAAEAYDFLNEIKADGRQFYAFSEATLDLIFPFIYGSLFAISLVKLWGLRYLLLVPFIAVMTDLVENTAAIYLASNFNESLSREQWIAANYTIVSLASVFTVIKWNSISLSIIIVVLGLIIFSVRKLLRGRVRD